MFSVFLFYLFFSQKDKSRKYFESRKVSCCFNEDFDLDKEDKKEINIALYDKEKTIIMSTLTDRVLCNVYKDTSSEMWKLLCYKYEVKVAFDFQSFLSWYFYSLPITA